MKWKSHFIGEEHLKTEIHYWRFSWLHPLMLDQLTDLPLNSLVIKITTFHKTMVAIYNKEANYHKS